MPKYYRGGAGYIHVRNFENVEQLLHQLILLDGEGFEPYRDMAKQYLSGDRVPARKLKRSALKKIVHTKPRDLVQHVVREVESHKDPSRKSQLGGGITEAAHTITHELLHLTGADVIAERVFGITHPNKMASLESQFAAYLTDITYKSIKDRKLNTLRGRTGEWMFTRLPQYDTSYTSVWRNNDTGDLTLTIRGTKLSASDLGQDAQILFGKTDVQSKDVETIMDQLEVDFPNQQYDVSAHSLGCDFVFSALDEHGTRWNDLYFFSPGSSPFQDTKVLATYANIDTNSGVTEYHINSGDVVPDALRQQMDADTLEHNVFFGPYRYAPWSAHSLTQFIPSGLGQSDVPGPGEQHRQFDNEPTSFDIAEYHRDTAATQAAGLS